MLFKIWPFGGIYCKGGFSFVFKRTIQKLQFFSLLFNLIEIRLIVVSLKVTISLGSHLKFQNWFRILPLISSFKGQGETKDGYRHFDDLG